MSHSVDECYDVYRESERQARKLHQCDACGDQIRPGDRYFCVGIVFEGEGESVKRCLRCQRIHQHLRTLAPGDMWPDERLNCGEEYTEHWGREPPPEIAALAFALPGETK